MTLSAREFVDRCIDLEKDAPSTATVEVRYRQGTETIQLPASAVFLQESPAKVTLVIEVLPSRTG